MRGGARHVGGRGRGIEQEAGIEPAISERHSDVSPQHFTCRSLPCGRLRETRFGAEEGAWRIEGGSDGNRTRLDLIDSEATSPDVSRASRQGGARTRLVSGAARRLAFRSGRRVGRPIIVYSIVIEGRRRAAKRPVSTRVVCPCPIEDTESRGRQDRQSPGGHSGAAPRAEGPARGFASVLSSNARPRELAKTSRLGEAQGGKESWLGLEEPGQVALRRNKKGHLGSTRVAF